MKKEAFLLQISVPGEDTPRFVNITDKLGSTLQMKKPLATCALRVTDNFILFSLLRLTDPSRKKLKAAPLTFPFGPLRKLEETAETMTVPPKGSVAVQLGDSSYVLPFDLDANGVLSFDLDMESEVHFELPRSPISLTLLLESIRPGLPVAVSWTGYQNKPGAPETLSRVVSHALYFMTTLGDFSALTGITTVKTPPPPGRGQVVRAVSSNVRVSRDISVGLWTDDKPNVSVASGTLNISVDLESANMASRTLLYKYILKDGDSDSLDVYKGVIDQALNTHMISFFDQSELNDILFSITLGELEPGTIERLEEALSKVKDADFTPTKYIWR